MSVIIDSADTLYIITSGMDIMKNEPKHPPIIIEIPSPNSRSFRISHSLWKFVTQAIEFPILPSLKVIPESWGGIPRNVMSHIEITDIPHDTNPHKNEETQPIKNIRIILISSTMRKSEKIYRENR